MSRARSSTSAALLLSLLMLLAAAVPVHAATQESEGPPGEGLGPYPYAPDEVLVKFDVPVLAPAWLDTFSAEQGITLAEFIPDISWYVFKISDGSAVVDKLDRLRGLPGVVAVSASGGGEVAFTPNDPQYVNQWYLPRMRVNSAWDHAGGGTSGPVVIVDAGVNNHVELGNIVRANFTDVSDGDRCGTWGHGTFMAGIALAFTNNSTGIAGISYNSPVYSAKVIRDNAGNCNVLASQWVANGINWAVNQGAKAINASFVANDSQVIRDAVNRAWNNGALVVGATGNNGQSNFNGLAPAMYLTAAAVGGTVRASSAAGECRHPSSNYGAPGVDFVAPLQDITSTTSSGGYVTWGFGGTSSSAALTTGVVGLMLGHYGNIAPQAIKDKLAASADWVCGQTGYSNQTGAGRIDAFGAVNLH